MNRIKALFSSFFILLSSIAFAGSAPVSTLETAANQILSVLKQHKSELATKPELIYQAVQTHLVPIVDVQGMSRSVLGAQAWNKATSSERQAFTSAFTRLVVHTYAKPLAKYSNETVKFMPLRTAATGKFVRVNSLIVRPQGKDIPLAYSLVNKNGQWKVYDLSVEGVSLLQSFRSQFAQELRHGSIADLLKDMQNSQKAA